MTKAVFKEEIIVVRDLVQKHQIKLVINESLGGYFIVTSDVQEWIAKEIFHKQ